MRFRNLCILGSTLLLATAVPTFANPKVHRGPTSPRVFKERAQQKSKLTNASGISSERATQIQVALVKAGYLSGVPSGIWDSDTKAAMAKLQADNGWQTKLVPDARAITYLGLGPASSQSVATASSL